MLFHVCRLKNPRINIGTRKTDQRIKDGDTARPATTELGYLTASLLKKSLSKASLAAYKHTWKAYREFKLAHELKGPLVPVQLKHLTNFVSFLFEKGFASSTIISYMSAISFVHKLLGIKDPLKSFVLPKLLQGIQKTKPRGDTRKPITRKILYKLVDNLGQGNNKYKYSLYKAMYLVAFHAFLRVGEFALATKRNTY